MIAPKYLARKRAKQYEAQKAQERADMIKTVKADAVRLAVKGFKTYGLPNELESREFDELPLSRRITILEDYIDQLRELGSRLSHTYGDIPGAKEQLEDISTRINAAGGLIVQIELEDVKPKVPDIDDDRPRLNR